MLPGSVSNLGKLLCQSVTIQRCGMCGKHCHKAKWCHENGGMTHILLVLVTSFTRPFLLSIRLLTEPSLTPPINSSRASGALHLCKQFCTVFALVGQVYISSNCPFNLTSQVATDWSSVAYRSSHLQGPPSVRTSAERICSTCSCRAFVWRKRTSRVPTCAAPICAAPT